ncbi:MAG: cytidine deaminase [Planctomycetales bacterium]|nr:cytidine deaminase [Planctomycetales bacterium]
MSLVSDDRELIQAAVDAQQQAYAPYSNFMVGAAIRTPAGRLVVGCNVENVSYGLTVCAERCAVGNMVVGGEPGIAAMAIASVGGVAPCGACRQVLWEFGRDFPLLLIDSRTGRVRGRCTMSELLPRAFALD